jgi:hypothetical protein
MSEAGSWPPGGLPAGLVYSWWRGDELPPLQREPAFTASPSDDAPLIAELAALSVDEVQSRIHNGNTPYLAWWNGEPVAYGWSASRVGEIGEIGLRFELPASDRYLWDFVTLPAWRGRKIYPRLLQAILSAEGGSAERFWIGHDAENLASGRGIRAAGFRLVGEGRLLPGGHFALAPVPRALERAERVAQTMGVRLLEEEWTDPGTLSGAPE